MGPVVAAVIVRPPGDDGVQPWLRSSSVRSVRRWIRILRSRSLLAFSASVLIGGKNPVKFRPLLVRASRARKVNPRKETRCARGRLDACRPCSRRSVSCRGGSASPPPPSARRSRPARARLAACSCSARRRRRRSARTGSPGTPGPSTVERVVQEQVRQDRRNCRPLRGSLARSEQACHPGAAAAQPATPDIEQHPAAVGDRLDRTDHQVPGNGVEELLDVKIDHPVVLPAPLPAYLDRVMSRPVAAGSHRNPVEPGLHQRLQKHGYRRLRDPVSDRRHAQHPGPRRHAAWGSPPP